MRKLLNWLVRSVLLRGTSRLPSGIDAGGRGSPGNTPLQFRKRVPPLQLKMAFSSQLQPGNILVVS